MSASIDTVLIIHVATEWRTTNYRYAFRALAESLPSNAAVLCVNRPIDPIATSMKHPKKFWAGVWSMRDESISDRMRVVTPRLLLHEQLAGNVPGFTRVNRGLLRRQLQRALRRWAPQAKRLIQWIHHPVQHWVYDVFPDAGKVYLCYDEYTYSWDGIHDPGLWEREKHVLEESDIVFVTSGALLRRRSGLTRRVELMPNGVPDFFFTNDRGPAADPLAHVPRPRLGFLGNIRNLLDFALLERILTRRSEWQMVFIGPIAAPKSVRALRDLPNVHFLGPWPHEDLRPLLEQLDVGLMPFLVSEFLHASHPHKMYEYMAAGLPVVSTNLETIRCTQPLVRLSAPNPDAFERAIAETLAEDRTVCSPRLRAAAREHTWTNIHKRFVIPALRDTFGF